MRKFTILLYVLLIASAIQAQIVHPQIGETVQSPDKRISLELVGKKQYFNPGDKSTADADINSPKSINVHPNGKKFYVNSLEGATTVVYDMQTYNKLKVIKHVFDQKKDAHLWSAPSDLYPFTHYENDHLNSFYGKPVESTFSHRGRYLWIPYYRRSYDINAQDPSAVAIIDTHTDSIIRLMDTGPLPKMIATSLDGKYVAISQWGDNTVGIINIESENPFDWHYTNMAIIDQKLKLNFSLTRQVDRDNNSGHCLRGTAFTPDNHYLLVGCMAGTGGIAVVDLHTMEYLGRITGMMPNLRHLIIRGDHLYLSINRDGYVQKIPLSTFLSTIPTLKSSANKTATLSGWQNCKVGAGARTIEMSPNNRLIFAACNNSSSLYVIDAQSMQALTSISVDSYPVGLDISADGKYVFVTSQGRSNGGGNCVDIFQVKSEEQK